MRDYRTLLEEENDLWHAHGTLLRDKHTQLSILLVAPKRSGKSNIADRLLQIGGWELIVNDYLEWTVRDDNLYGGFRFSNKPAQFWFRDANDEKIYRNKLWDKRVWTRVGAICSISVFRTDGEVKICKGHEGDQAYWGNLYTGRSNRWKSINAGVTAKHLSSITSTLKLPKEFSNKVFDTAATMIDNDMRPTDKETDADKEIVFKLNSLYEKFDSLNNSTTLL